MFTYNEIKNVHIEISSLCQASCPMCARNHHGGLPNPLLPEKNIDLEFYKKIMPTELIQQLESISMCGNFGDPILNGDLIDIIKHTVSYNPCIRFDIHSNGSARSTTWWEELAKALPPNHVLHFGIDGLEDTHHLYRVGTSFNKIIENAKAFIAAGGKARWNFITFKHNEHQMEACRQMARDLGFESFHEKQTSRFIAERFFDVVDRNGNFTHRLEEPTERKIIFLEKETVLNYKTLIKQAKISCEILPRKSVYVDAQGYLWPCCFLGAVPYQYSAPGQLLVDFKDEGRRTLYEAIEPLGGIEGLNLRNRTIQDIVDSEPWQTIWDKAFLDNSVIMCARVCGKYEQPIISQCRDQFLELENFNDK